MRNIFVRLAIYLTVLLALFGTGVYVIYRTSVVDYVYIFIPVYILLCLIFILTENTIYISRVKEVSKAEESVSGGNMDVRINKKPYDKHIKKLTDEFNNMAAAFENLEELRKSFLSNASHELRSPLTTIQGFLMAILDGTVDESDKDKYLKIVLNESKRLSEIVISMLNLSRLESGNFPLTYDMFDINVMISEIVFKFERKSKTKDISIETAFNINPCFVYADKPKIEQVLINLIDNAINYSPNNTKIVVTTSQHVKKAYISVKDNGFGIEKKEQAFIFDRFYTVDKARTPSKSKGTGIGLAIVKKIIADHNEIIWVDSAKDVGSTFTFTMTLFDPLEHTKEPEKPAETMES